MQSIDDLKAYLVNTFSDEQIYLFGSRAKGKATPYSDIDIALRGTKALGTKLTLVREAIENSDIPYKVDLIDLSRAPYLETVVEREGIRWH
jgi:predicted nucleotidyltransferase